MAEQEELQLRVTLDDQASAQLSALRGQLDQMRQAGPVTAQVQQASPQIVAAIGDVVKQLSAMAQQIGQLPAQITTAMSSAVQGLQQVQTQLTQIGTQVQQNAQAVAAVPGHVAHGAQALGSAIRQAGFFGGIAAGVTTEFIGQLKALGNNLLERATDFKGLANSMENLETHARGVGQTMTGYKGLTEQLQLGGMSAEQAQKVVSQFSDLSLELKQYGAENAPTTHRLIQDTDPATTNYILKTMKAMEGAPIEKQINLWTELRENMQQTMQAAGKGEGFEAAWKEISQRAGIDPEAFERLKQGVRLKKELDAPGREANYQARTEETKKFTYESAKAQLLWKDIGESIAASLLHGLGLNNAMGELNTWLERIRVDAEAFEKAWRDVDFDHALEQLGKMEPAIKPFLDEIRTFVTKDLKDLEKSLNSILEWEHGIGKASKEPDVGTKIQRRELEQRGWSDEQIDEYFKKHPLPPDARKPYTYDDLKKWLHGGKEASPQSQEPSAIEKYFGRKFGPRTGVPESDIREYEGAAPPAPPTPPTPPTPRTPPTSSTDLTAEQQERLQRRYTRGGAGAPPPQQPTGTELTPEQQEQLQRGGGEAPQQPTQGKPIIVPPIDVKPQQPRPPRDHTPHSLRERQKREEEEQQKREQDEREPELKPLGPFDPIPTPPPPGPNEGRAANVDPSQRFPQFPRSSRVEDYRPPGGGEYHSMLDPDATAKQQQFLKEYNERLKMPEGQAWLNTKEPSFPTGSPLEKLIEGADKYIKGAVAHSSRRRLESWGKASSSQFVGTDEAADQPSSFENRFGVWPGMGADKLDQTSAKLDEAANQNVNISGAGKIQVDVRAPPGTSVAAQSDGFFKSTEITRMTQMMPADFGPGPVTGVSAGQGVAANGTVGAA
jgi:hypothetical protein